jgi:hypothetical protein
MTFDEARRFAEEFARQRSRGRGEALWSSQGVLHYPFADRLIGGDEIGALCDLTAANSPNLTWEMLGWTHRDDVIVVEWRCTNRYGEHTMVFDGVDKLTVKDGKIVEEIVYTDTAPLRAARAGTRLEPLVVLPRATAPA